VLEDETCDSHPRRRHTSCRARRYHRHPGRLGGPPPRPRRRCLCGSAGCLRRGSGGRARRDSGRLRRPRPAQRVLHHHHGRGVETTRRERQPRPAHRGGGGGHLIAGRAQQCCSIAVPDRRAGHGRGGGPAEVPLPRPSPSGPRCSNPAPERRQPGRPYGPGRPRLRRDRDPDVDPLHPGGSPRLPGTGTAQAGLLVRAAAEPAAVQAAADGGRDGAVLPDRPLLPRRGLPRRSAAGVHPARRRDELRRPGRHHRADRGDTDRGLAADRLPDPDADSQDDVRRRDGPVRHRQARPALRLRDRRADRLLRRHAVPGVPGPVRRRGRHARRRLAAAADVRRLAGVGQAARRQGPGLRHRRRGRR
ncbi:MAG: Aspartyl-tRNA synthetase @ Aspartyl-tRNA(Asn) synthetase, partial [uncultured Propionibacteriaceae bacterium]